MLISLKIYLDGVGVVGGVTKIKSSLQPSAPDGDCSGVHDLRLPRLLLE